MHTSIFPLDVSDYSNKSPCHSVHYVLGLCHSRLAYLYACTVFRRHRVIVYVSMIEIRQYDRRRMSRWRNPLCGTSMLDRMSLRLFAIQRSTTVLATSHLLLAHSRHHHQAQHWLTLIWFVDFMFELSESNRIGWHPVTRVWLDDIVFVPGDSSLIGWHFAWPIRVILFGLVCFEAVWLDGLVRW